MRKWYQKHSKAIVIVLLTGLTFTGFIFREWNAALAPSSALVDEASFGYIAYSLLNTGRDEHGVSWPLVFQAFGDQKLPLNAYLTIPAVKIFGLNPFAVRLPSILAGTLLIPAVYWLLYTLYKRNLFAFCGASVTAFSAWTFILSRFAFEANVTLLIFCLAMGSIVNLVRKPTKILALVSGLLLAMTWYGYIAFRPVTLILILLIGVMLIKVKHWRLCGSILLLTFILAIIPLFTPTALGANQARFRQVGLVYDPGVGALIDEQRTFCSSRLPKIACYILYNKGWAYSETIIRRYIKAFSPEFMAVSGAETASYLNVAGYGLFTLIGYGLFICGTAGLVILGNKLFRKKIWIVIFVGLFAAPLPAIFAGDPQLVRLTPWYPFVLIALVFGVYLIEKSAASRYGHSMIYGIVGFLLVLNMAVFYRFYTTFTTVHVWQHGEWYQDYAMGISAFIRSVPDSTLTVINPFYGDALLFHAFYTQLDPTIYQREIMLAKKEASGFQHAIRLGNIINESLGIKEAACLALGEGKRKVIYITNEQLNLPVAYEAKSHNGVHTFARAYNVEADSCLIY